MDMSGFECYLYFEQYKLRCRCGYRGYEGVGFVGDYLHCTKAYEEYTARLCDFMSVKEAASIVGLDWKTVKDIDKANIRSTLKGLSEEEPLMIGVDEVAYQKSHKYLTVVRDVDEGRVLWVVTETSNISCSKL
jgi:transposase